MDASEVYVRARRGGPVSSKAVAALPPATVTVRSSVFSPARRPAGSVPKPPRKNASAAFRAFVSSSDSGRRNVGTLVPFGKRPYVKW